MRRHSALLAVLTLLYAPSAFATGGISCAGKDRSISISTGRLPVLDVLAAQAEISGQSWSTNETAGTQPFVFGQGMTETNRIAADFTDTNISRIIVSLRIDTTSDYKGSYEGTLAGEDGTPVPVLCDLE